MDYEALLKVATDLGVALQEAGAEIYRVEESVSRLLAAYCAAGGEVFAIPSCLIVGLTTAEGRSLTRMRRIPYHGTDIHRLERLNALCRALCREVPALTEAAARLEEVCASTAVYRPWVQLFGYFLATASFSLFFGGSWRDAVAGGLCGLAVGAGLRAMSTLRVNLFFKTIVAAFLSGLLALVLVAVGLGQGASFVRIGALMALVPGIGVTNCMRDIMTGDLMTGMLRMVEALFIGGAIALGSGLVMALLRLWGWPL